MKKSEIITCGTILLVVLLTGLYYRTYDLRDYFFKTQKEIEQDSFQRVEDFMHKQLIPQMKTQYSHLSAKEFKQKIIEATKALQQRDFAKYHDRLTRTMAGSVKNAGLSGLYLLGADSYHYYDLTRRIQKNGNISDSFRNGNFFHPGRHAPFGMWEQFTLHPYLGYFAYKIFKPFIPKMDLMAAASLLPVLLYVVLIIVFLVTCKTLDGKPLGVLAGGLALAFSPLLIQRTFFGWYDTDPYSLIFPFAIFACYFRGANEEDKKKVYIQAVLAGVLTFLFALFWQGWPLFAGIVVISGGIIWILNRFRGDVGMHEVGRFVPVYIAVVLLSMIARMGPIFFVKWSWGLVVDSLKFSSRDTSAWPDMYIIVRETQFVGIDKVIEHVGSIWIIGVALIGILGYAIRCLSEEREETWGPWITTIMTAAITTFLSLKTERFSLLVVIPLAICVMWGVTFLYEVLRDFLTNRLKKVSSKWISLGVAIALLVAIVPPQAHSALARVRITDLRFFYDAWFKVMGDIQKKSPENATIMSWWPSGYFISAVGERDVFTDGGSQHLPEAYWSARFYFATSEREALGITRMMNAGGNKATRYLTEDQGMRLDKAIELVNKVILLSREEAKGKLPKEWKEEEKETFLDSSHGDRMQPTYVMAYQDIVRKVSSLSIIARWEFDNAIKWKERDTGRPYKQPPPSDPFLVQKSLPFPSSILKAEEPSDVIHKDGDVLYFRNGFRWNPKTLDAFYAPPRDRSIQGNPLSVYYIKDGQFLEKIWAAGQRISVSVLVYEDEGKWYCVLAAPTLIRSMIWRMYYLKGLGLKYFKNFSRERNPLTGHWVLSYEVDWKAAGIPTGEAINTTDSN